MISPHLGLQDRSEEGACAVHKLCRFWPSSFRKDLDVKGRALIEPVSSAPNDSPSIADSAVGNQQWKAFERF